MMKDLETEELKRKNQCIVKICLGMQFFETVSKCYSPWHQVMIISIDEEAKLQCPPERICNNLFMANKLLLLVMKILDV